jgi:hypothetical protein
LHQTGDIRPEQVQEALRWMISVFMLEYQEHMLQSVYERANEIMRDLQFAYLMANRQRTLLAVQYKFMVAVVLMLALLMPPAFAFAPAQAIPPITVDPQTIYNAIASAPKVSAYVDAQFVWDCVKGFPEGIWYDANYGAGAAGVATEIAATAYTPKILVLQSGDLVMTYFGSWEGPKMAQRLTGFLDRVPPRDEGLSKLKIVWQNLFSTTLQQTRRGDPRDQDECQACMRAVVTAAHRVKVLKQEGAKAVAIGAAAACTGLSGGILIGICIAAAAATLALYYNLAEAEFQDRILSAKNDECAVDRRTGKSCEWER